MRGADNRRMTTRIDLLHLYRERGDLAYDGEGVSQLQHAWQCGRLARADGAAPTLALAAWLHDVGHLMTDLPGSPTLDGIDDRHEVLGARALMALFGEDVGAPVALHVAAKRYLVATEPSYLDALSPDSRRSLALQGGAMSASEVVRFERSPFAAAACRVRRWDDLGKTPDLVPPSRDIALAELASLMAAVDPVG